MPLTAVQHSPTPLAHNGSSHLTPTPTVSRSPEKNQWWVTMPWSLNFKGFDRNESRCARTLTQAIQSDERLDDSPQIDFRLHTDQTIRSREVRSRVVISIPARTWPKPSAIC